MRFERDDAGIEEIVNGAGTRKLIDDTTAAIAADIIRFSPRGFMDYSDSVRAIPATTGPGGAVGYVGSDSPVWHLAEYGTLATPARSPIRRAVAESGIRFEEGR